MKVGDYVYTSRFCAVKIKEIFTSVEDAQKSGYCEPTYYKGEYMILGKVLDQYSMEFAAIPKEHE